MSTVELKDAILKKLESADDALLREVLAIIEFETNGEVYKTSQNEKDAVNKGLQQIKEGKGITNKAVEKDIDEWLSR